jgi:UrcA family protein
MYTSIRSIRFSSFTTLAAAAALCAVALATARPALAADVPRVTVQYGDLNLASTPGVTQLYGRIRSAAATVCGTPPDIRDLNRGALWVSCRDQAIANAVLAVGNPALTALHTGKPAPEQVVRMASTAPTGR